jgi:hypothetical protein
VGKDGIGVGTRSYCMQKGHLDVKGVRQRPVSMRLAPYVRRNSVPVLAGVSPGQRSGAFHRAHSHPVSRFEVVSVPLRLHQPDLAEALSHGSWRRGRIERLQHHAFGKLPETPWHAEVCPSKA